MNRLTEQTDHLTAWIHRANAQLIQQLDAQDSLTPSPLIDAMRYACLSTGKRLRPSLIYACAPIVGCTLAQLDGPATAVEMIHCYSLIHDDLPAMDDDDLRRGQPACHIAFDEATAILAGDSLHSLAFECLATPDQHRPEHATLNMITHLSRAIGGAGMAGGQCIDIQLPGTTPDIHVLENMYQRKTGQLIQACITLAMDCSNTIDPETALALNRYASAFGLAFQIQDDLLELHTDPHILGKPIDSDSRKAQPTYPSLMGEKAATDIMESLYTQTFQALDSIGETATQLRLLTQTIYARHH